MKISLLLFILILIFKPGIIAQETELELPLPKSYTITKIITPLIIDGKANERAWSNAEWTDLFMDIEGPSNPAPYYDTRVKMLWDDNYIYFFAEMEEEHVWGDITERDAVIFYNNDFEIFIKPNQYQPVYAEFEVNALGTLWELLLHRPYRRNGPVFDEWDVNDTRIGIEIDGTLNDPSDTDKSWSLEMAIPLDALNALDRGSKIEHGSVWRINFSRVQWEHDIDDGEYSKKTDAEGNRLPEYNWVWTPQHVINMHEPERWGYLYFVDGSGNGIEKDQLETEYQYLFYLYRSMLGKEVEAGLGTTTVNNKELFYMITPTKLGFEITVSNTDGASLTVNQDGYIYIENE